MSTEKTLPPADVMRIELVTAIHSLASCFENALYAFGKDAEARKVAEGDIAHAMKTAAKYNQNGATVSEQPLTDEQIAAALEAGGVGLQRFMGGLSGQKDCWTTAGSVSVPKIAAVVRGLMSKGGAA